MSVTSVIGAASPVLTGLFGLIDDLFTSDEEREALKLKVIQLNAEGKLAQLSVNAEEAKHRSLFVAGWRPATGWVCVVALAWQFIVLPLFVGLISLIAAFTGAHPDFSNLLTFDVGSLMPVLLGMLGLGGLRTFEKFKGVSS